MADKQYPPPTNPTYNPPPPAYYQPPAPAQQSTVSNVTYIQQGQASPVIHHSTVVQNNQRPPVVVQTTTRPAPTQTGGFFSQLGKAFDSAATDLSKAADSAAHSIVNPMEILRGGNKILIESKSCGRNLKVLETGLLECSTDKGLASQFLVVKPIQGSNVMKLRNVAQPNFFLAVQNGFTVGYGSGGTDCDFVPSVLSDSSITLESVMTPGSHIGVLPSGEMTAPAQTTKQTTASHFKIKFIGV